MAGEGQGEGRRRRGYFTLHYFTLLYITLHDGGENILLLYEKEKKKRKESFFRQAKTFRTIYV